MIALRIDFLAGQLHANPWDRSTGEGAIEWPPSPWRLLCAIIGGWHHSGAPDRDTLLRVVNALAGPPSFDLPVASSGHTRHSAHVAESNAATPQGTLMLDSFVAIDSSRAHETQAFAFWPDANLDAPARKLLELCCSGIQHLGWAEAPESTCEISLVPGIPSIPGRYRVDVT